MSYFRSSGGVEYVPGGVKSGFRHVAEENPEPRLLQVKGKRNVRVTPVPVAASSMNHGDCFILDLGDKIFLWSGSEANRHEKGKAMEVMTRLYNSRGAKAERIVMDEEPDNEEFWGTLAGSPSDVLSADEGGSDEAVSRSSTLRLYRVSNESGSMETTEVEKRDGQLHRDMLDENDVFILDVGNSLFVWVGREANDEEKANALETANKFAEEGGSSSRASATVIRQYMEPVEFKSMFHQWNPPSSFDFSHKPSGDIARDLPKEAIDFAAVRKGNPESERMIDDGSGTVRVWRIVDHDMTELEESEIGEFFSGDSYVVHYHYTDPKTRREGDLIYFWLGRNSETIEKGTAAARTVELSDSLGGGVPQIRLTQGKEPPHFCAIFKNNMVVHNGGMRGQREPVEGEPRLYQVKGFQPNTTRAVEIAPSAENLNSGDCFVLVEANRVALWQGQHSSEEEREVATNIANRLSKGNEVAVLAEGEEDDQFWESLGGKADYPEASAAETGPEQPRLFNVSDRTGTLRMEEVTNFAQDDLLDDDVMILDTVNQIFVWIGREASPEERKNATRIAEDYLSHSLDGRDADVPIIVEQSGKESKLFTCNFPGWDETKAAVFVDPYQSRLQQLRQEKRERAAWQEEAEKEAKARQEAVQQLEAERKGSSPHAATNGNGKHDEGDSTAAAAAGGGGGGAGLQGDEEEVARRIRAAGDDSETRKRLEEAKKAREERLAKMVEKAGPSVKPGEATYPLEELRSAKPDGGWDIDFSQKETYLTDADFQEAFGMDRERFNAMPSWRRKTLKQKVGLF